MSRAYVLHHPDLGIFLRLDECGFCEWSAQDDGPRGNYAAKVWQTPEGAMGFIDTFWEIADGIQAHAVDVADSDVGATVRECVKAGLPRWDPEEET
jgi:hypothetical protein